MLAGVGNEKHEGRNHDMKKCMGYISFIVLLFLFSSCSALSQEEAEASQSSLFAMNTYMTFTAYGDDAESALEEAKQQIQELESLWSVTDTGSEIYAANHSGGKPVTIGEETAAVVSFALHMAQQTEGALDPSIYPILTAWGFTTDNKQVPPADEIQALLQNVDYSRIHLDGTSLTVPDGMALDLGAVGKGYAADLVTEVLKEHGVESALISLGGNIQAIGSRPDGSDWHIGIQAPWEEGNLGILEISDAGVVTSGGYENYFEDEEGNKYWHILDPSTGYPANSGLEAAVIVVSEGKLCDALSTALFVMGPDKAETYWREHGNFDMLLVTDKNEIIITEGIADRFTLNDGRTETIRVIEE